MHVGALIAMGGLGPYAVSLMNNQSSLTELFAFIFLTAIMVILLIMIIHKAHALMYETADHVIRYVSGEARPTGERDSETKAGAAFGATSRRTEEAGVRGAGRPSSPGKPGAAPTGGNNAAHHQGKGGG